MPRVEKRHSSADQGGGAVATPPHPLEGLELEICLEFQREAAGVYGTLACLLQKLYSLLEDAEFRERRSQTNRRDSRALVAAVEREIAIWLSISHGPFQRDWEEMLGALEDCLELAEEYAEFQEPLSRESLAEYRSRLLDFMIRANVVIGRQVGLEQRRVLVELPKVRSLGA